MRILGIDPGLKHTGWGIIEGKNAKFYFIAAGIIHSDTKKNLPDRLCELHEGLLRVIDEFNPDEASIEQTFVNANPVASLKLGQARGAVMIVPALRRIPVFEYTANQIKKMVVGVGHADKKQVDMMVHNVLKGMDGIKLKADASDALAIAACHGYVRLSLLGEIRNDSKIVW